LVDLPATLPWWERGNMLLKESQEAVDVFFARVGMELLSTHCTFSD
jgi:hypothetical protein